MRNRLSARLFVLDQDDRVLLFRFVHKKGALAGQDYWATPGGSVEAGETFEEAARRELFEETGIAVDAVGAQVIERELVLQMPDGEYVLSQERFFLVRVSNQELSRENWTALESEVMAEHRWWSLDELSSTRQTIFPEDIADVLRQIQNNSSGGVF